MPLPPSPLAAWLGEAGASPPAQGPGLLLHEEGAVVGILTVAGAALALREPKSRALGAGLVAVLAAGLVALRLGVPAGPTRYGAPLLAALGAQAVLAAGAGMAGVAAVARARLPYAETSAAMVVLLALAVPVQAVDDTALRLSQRPVGASAVWDLSAFGAAPAGAVVLVDDPAVLLRVAAARASGSFRADLSVIAVGRLDAAEATRLLVREPALSPFVRDVLLAGVPGEFALSALAEARPVLLAYDPRWERTLARHLVPRGLLDRFLPEPAAGSDRRQALDQQGPLLDRLGRVLGSPLEPELRRAAAVLLRARVHGLVAAGDRETALREAAALGALSPDEPVVAEVRRRFPPPQAPPSRL